MKNKVDKYNYGIDLLKIISMMFIVILHILGMGGVLKNNMNTLQYATCWGLEILCYCSVDCFAIISGYVSFRDKPMQYKFSNYIVLWMQVSFYNLLFTILFNIVGYSNVGVKNIIMSLMPVTFCAYWYFNAYTGLFILMPLLNVAIGKLDKKILEKVILVIVMTLSVYGIVASHYNDVFNLNNGYSMIWLCILYCIGAFIRKNDLLRTTSYKKSMFLFVSSYLLTCVWFLAVGKAIGHGLDNLFVSYISPTILGMAIGLVLFFGKLNISNNVKKTVMFISPAVFGVYLIHVQPLVFKYIISDSFKFIASQNFLLIPLEVIGLMLIIFFTCIMIDKLRIQLFKLLHVKQFAKFIDTKINLVLDKIVEKI